MSSLALWLGVGVLGGAASVARFLLDRRVQALALSRFPLGTFTVNVSGALVLGVLVGAGLSGDAFLLLGTATIGSYTTFSTWMLESQRLAEGGGRRLAALNLVVGLALGAGAIALGRLIGGG
ncbi:MAG TPA: fluoride efflux transporter CrcB [Solirubrobacteraceae bacterium]